MMKLQLVCYKCDVAKHCRIVYLCLCLLIASLTSLSLFVLDLSYSVILS